MLLQNGYILLHYRMIEQLVNRVDGPLKCRGVVFWFWRGKKKIKKHHAKKKKKK